MNSSYKELRVWQQAMDLVIEVYEAVKRFPRSERSGLSDQLRRAAVSVPSNIAEGKGHRSGLEFARYLYHARGSLLEVETQIMLAGRLHYIDQERTEEVLRQTTTVGEGLNALINSIVGDQKLRTVTSNS
jgi:four helix bundle protein